MGNLIKINMYVEAKNKNKLNLRTVEEFILEYNSWLKKTNREDKIETYAEFIQA